MGGEDGRIAGQQPVPSRSQQQPAGDSSRGVWRPDQERPETDAQREPGDALDRLPGDDLPGDLPADATGFVFPGAQPDVITPAWLRARNRFLIREFLGSVPRSEPNATIALFRSDGTIRVLTRADFTAAIDRLRPRMRQIMRLSHEERWQRSKICEHLNGISLTTFERDHTEAFNALLQLPDEDE
jgi:hypothetical protein